MDSVSPEAHPEQRARGRLSTANRFGLGLAGLLGLLDLPTALYDPPQGFASPSRAVLVAATVCGAVSIVGVLLCWWPKCRPITRLVVASRLLSMVLGLAAFTVSPVEGSVKAFAIASVPATIMTVGLLFRPTLRGGVGHRS